MLLKDLQSVGFSKNLAEIYLCLAQLGGQAKAGVIIKKLGIHRNIVYIGLDKLIEKKLITKVSQSGVMIYRILDPARIMNEIREKENLVKNIIEEIESLKQHPNTQEVTVHEGLDGFRSYNMRTLKEIKEGGTLYILGSFGDDWYKYMGEEKYKKYFKLQSQKKIMWKVISYYSSERDKKLATDTSLCIRKQIPQTYRNPANTHIFNDTIAFQISTEPFSVIEIKNKSLADVYRNFFDLLWNQNVSTYIGWDEVEKLFFKELLPGQKKGDRLYCLGGGYGTTGEDKRVADFYLKYNKIRIKNKVFLDILFYEHHREKALNEFADAGDINLKYTNVKFLPSSYYSPLQIYLMNNKTIIITWGEKPTATVYSESDVYTSFKKQFDLLWDQEVFTYHGWEEIDRVMRNNLEEGYTHDIYGANYGDSPKEAMNFYVEYHKKTAFLRPKKRIIFFERDRTTNAEKEVSELDSITRKHIKTRFVSDKYYSPMETHVFKDKIILIFLFDKPIATMYTNPKIIEAYKKQFEFWWNMSK